MNSDARSNSSSSVIGLFSGPAYPEPGSAIREALEVPPTSVGAAVSAEALEVPPTSVGAFFQ